MLLKGLVNSLGSVSEGDIRNWFSPFGEIEQIELGRHPVTGKVKGYCVITFTRHRDAKDACKAMDE